MKKRIFLSFVLILVALFCGCGKNSSDDDKENGTTEIQADGTDTFTESVVETKDEALQMPDKDRVINDLSERHCNTISFTGWDETITVTVVETILDKAKVEDKTYIAYSTMKLNDEYYFGEISYVLTYNYYEVGGWILDEIKEQSRTLKAKKCVQEQSVKNYIIKADEKLGRIPVAEFEHALEDVLIGNGSDTWGYTLWKKCSTTYVDYYYMDSVKCTFDENAGWIFTELDSVFYNEDWSRIVGTEWYCIDRDAKYTISITGVDLEKKQISTKVVGQCSDGWIIGGTRGDNDAVYTYSISDTASYSFRWMDNPYREYAPTSVIDLSIQIYKKYGGEDRFIVSLAVFLSPTKGVECIWDNTISDESYNVTRLK